jgi:hypothetical protein
MRSDRYPAAAAVRPFAGLAGAQGPRWLLLWLVLVALCHEVPRGLCAAATTPPYSKGDRLRCVEDVDVASNSRPVHHLTQTKGESGTVAEEPRLGDQQAAWWLHIKWDNGIDGWTKVVSDRQFDPLSPLPRLRLEMDSLVARVRLLAWLLGACGVAVMVLVAGALWGLSGGVRSPSLFTGPTFPPGTVAARSGPGGPQDAKVDAVYDEIRRRIDQIEAQLRSARPTGRSVPTVSPGSDAESARLKQRLDQLAQAQKTWESELTKLGQRVEAVAARPTGETQFNELRRQVSASQQAVQSEIAELRRQMAASISAPTSPGPLPPSTSSATAPPPPAVRLSREEIGRRFVRFCRDEREYLDTAFERALASGGAGGAQKPGVKSVYRPTAAQDTYFTDEREGPSHAYWRVSWDDVEYLLPCPTARHTFAGQQGFVVHDPVAPARLQTCLPAVLRLNYRRWEIADAGQLG